MNWSSIGFRKRLILIMTFSGLIQLLVLSWSGFFYILNSQQQDMGQKALGVSQFLAKSDRVIAAVNSGSALHLKEEIRDFTEHIGATFIVIGDKKGVRLLHPLDERIGLPMKGGDNTRALKNGESYISSAVGSLGKSVRGKTAIFDRSGNIIGVVSVGYLLDSLEDRVEPFLYFLISLALVVLAVNTLLAIYVSKRFQKAILGFEPEEIGKLYVELDVTLSTIEEGVVSIDKNGVVRSVNKSACEILKLDRENIIDQPVETALPGSDLGDVLETGKAEHDANLYVNEQNIVANRNPIMVDGKVYGAVSSFRRRDEISELTQQLAQTKRYADMLRSQTHEHRNKLNTIAGLIQMNEMEAVNTLIGQESEHYQSMISFIRSAIDDPLVAGLILGKAERARELGLELNIEEGSRLSELPDNINAEDITTILGNLLDNAFDATLSYSVSDQTARVIELSVSDFGTEIILEVEDSGAGLPEGMTTAALLDRGVSTKSADSSNPGKRGVGLFLVNRLIKHYGGQLEMMALSPTGTRVTAYIPKERKK